MSKINIDDELKQLKCRYSNQHQDSEIVQLSLEEGIDIQNRLLCQYCLQTSSRSYQGMGIINVLDTIKEKFQNIENLQSLQINQEKQYLKDIKDSISTLKSELYQILEEFDNLINQLEDEFEALMINMNFNMMDEIKEIAEKQNQNFNVIFDKFNNSLMSTKNSYQKKFQNKVQKLQDSISSIVKMFTEQNSRNKEEEIQLIENNTQRISTIKIITNWDVKYTKICEIQSQCCLALAFDYECKQLAIGQKDSQVEIYNIDNGVIINKMSTLTLQHNNIIYSIVYSKDQSWLATGTEKGEIIIWKLQNCQWQRSNPKGQHKSTVFCCLLNQKEDLLLSCSEDQTIIIWNLDIAQNKIEIREQIKTQFGFIYSISLNKSENYLASCHRKDCIIIWEKKEQNTQWAIKQIIQLAANGFGFRLGFYGDYLIFQPQNIGICSIYEEHNNQFQKIQQLNIDLHNQESDPVGLSPIIYNQIKDIMILKHNKCVYFIRKQLDKQFHIIGKSMNYLNSYHFSTISQNGEYLAQWNDDNKIVSIFKLDYK